MQILFPFPVIYKDRRGLPRRFPLFLSRASLRECSFLALPRDIIPLDFVFFRGILFRFYFLLFQGNSIARLVCPFLRNYIPPAARCINAASSALPHFLPGDAIYLLPAENEDLTVTEYLVLSLQICRLATLPIKFLLCSQNIS